MSFPRYPKYKDSGVEWLGEVPEHWDVKRLKHCARLVTAKANDRINPVALENIEGWTGRLLPSDGDYQGEGTAFVAGDILFGKLRPYLAKVHLASQAGEAVGDFHVLRPHVGFDGNFAQYHMLTREFIGIVDGSTYGSKMPRASWEFVGGMPMAVPPPVEQPAIATFLDRETAKIDALIAEQQRLIELLQEKRQAVISHAVTKGLNPDAPMKDSGIEWLGEVPEHWEVRRLSSISTKITNGYVGPTRDILAESGVRYLQSLHIKKNSIAFNDPYFVSQEWSNAHAKSILKEGDVLIVQTGDIGQVAVVPKEFEGCNCHALIIVAPIRETIEGKWLGWVLNSEYGLHSLLAIQTGALHPHLNCGNVKDVWIPVPPLREQGEIVARVLERSGEMDSLITEAQAAISLLQERRSALISAAVTGQIDVRGLTGSEAA